MKPNGKPPKALTKLDDCIFDAQCSIDSQVLNTRTLLEYMDEADNDGRIDDDEWRYIFRHVRLEHHFNTETNGALTKGREWLNQILELIVGYRLRLEKKAALASGLHAARTS